MKTGKYEMSPMQSIAYGFIREIQGIKQANKQSPDFALASEIENSFKVELKEALNGLVRDGILDWKRTVNGMPMFGIKLKEKP